MGYALFAQRKLVLNGQLNSAQLQQTQRSNEQYKLATQSLSLQQQMTSLTASQSYELSLQYEKLSHVGQVQVTIDEGTLSWENANYNGEEWVAASNTKITDEQTKKNHEQMEIDREAINAEIKKIEAENQAELDDINRRIYLVGIKEASIEMEVKKLDTQVTALQQQLEAVQEAEGKAIQNATPKFKGVA